MFETLVSFVMVEHLYGETFRPALDTAGYKRVLNKERRPYPSKDGYFALLPYTDGHWKEFCTLVGRPDLAEDPRFQGWPTGSRTSSSTTPRWPGSAPSAPTPNGSSCSRTPTCRTGRSTRSTTCSSTRSSTPPATGRRSTIRARASCACPASPPRFSKTPPEITRLQPRLGEHSVEVLQEAGLQPGRDRRHAEIGRDQDGVRLVTASRLDPRREAGGNDDHPSDAARCPALGAAAACCPRRPSPRPGPAKPIKIVCTYPPGGLTDVFARAYGEYSRRRPASRWWSRTRRARPARSAPSW